MLKLKFPFLYYLFFYHLVNYFINLFDEIAKNLQEIKLNLSLENFNFANYEKISKVLFYLKGSKISGFKFNALAIATRCC